jgi:opacity protein-like surface antigen
MAALSGVIAQVAVAAQGKLECPSFNINVLGMRKELSNDWKPNNEQDEIGGNIDLRGAYWPVSLDLTYLYATNKGNVNETIVNGSTFNNVENRAITEEAGLGIKKIWTNNQMWSFFVAGGADWIKGSLRFTGTGIQNSFDQTKVGWYGSAGIYYTLFNFLNLGVTGRYSSVDLTIAGRDIAAGGWHYGFLAGFHF